METAEVVRLYILKNLWWGAHVSKTSCDVVLPKDSKFDLDSCLRKNKLSTGLGSHTPGSGPLMQFLIRYSAAFSNTVSVTWPQPSRNSLFHCSRWNWTRPENTELDNEGGFYLYSLSEHAANSFDFRAEFNFIFKQPFVFANWESSQILSFSNASTGIQISQGFYVFQKSVYWFICSPKYHLLKCIVPH